MYDPEKVLQILEGRITQLDERIDAGTLTRYDAAELRRQRDQYRAEFGISLGKSTGSTTKIIASRYYEFSALVELLSNNLELVEDDLMKSASLFTHELNFVSERAKRMEKEGIREASHIMLRSPTVNEHLSAFGNQTPRQMLAAIVGFLIFVIAIILIILINGYQLFGTDPTCDQSSGSSYPSYSSCSQ